MLHWKPGENSIRMREREKMIPLVDSYKNGALICPSLLTPWANPDVPKKFIKSFFSFSSTPTSTKIWPSTYFSLKFYRWMYHYMKNCTHQAQMNNAHHLLNLSTYSLQCLNDILQEVFT